MRKSLNLISIWKSSLHLRSCKLFLPSWVLQPYLLWFFFSLLVSSPSFLSITAQGQRITSAPTSSYLPSLCLAGPQRLQPSILQILGGWGPLCTLAPPQHGLRRGIPLPHPCYPHPGRHSFGHWELWVLRKPGVRGSVAKPSASLRDMPTAPPAASEEMLLKLPTDSSLTQSKSAHRDTHTTQGKFNTWQKSLRGSTYWEGNSSACWSVGTLPCLDLNNDNMGVCIWMGSSSVRLWSLHFTVYKFYIRSSLPSTGLCVINEENTYIFGSVFWPSWGTLA